MELVALMREEMLEFPHGGADAAWLVRIDGAPERPVLRALWSVEPGAGEPVTPSLPVSLLPGIHALLAAPPGTWRTTTADGGRRWLLTGIAPAAGGVEGTSGVLAVRHLDDPAWGDAARRWMAATARRLVPVLAEAGGRLVAPPRQPSLFPDVPATRPPGGRRRPGRRVLPLPRVRYGTGLPGIVGISRELRECCETIRSVAPTQVNVLIHGESGTGKEVLARALHRLSARRDGPLVGVNCAALPETLFESELFGHKAGAFTGAGKEKAGLLEAADGGTFFLDEIGDMPLALQIKLLRVMQERRVRRIGELRDRPVDVRFVAASHKDLPAEIAAGRFRLDLYYRLKVVSVTIPPLRQRPEDMAHLLAWFLERLGLPVRELGIEEPALAALQRYRWPGNVRELQNEAARWAALHGGEEVIRLEHLSPDIRRQQGVLVDASDLAVLRPVEEATELLEQYLIRKAIAASGGRKAAAARRLGLSRQGLYKKIRRYGMGDLLNAS